MAETQTTAYIRSVPCEVVLNPLILAASGMANLYTLIDTISEGLDSAEGCLDRGQLQAAQDIIKRTLRLSWIALEEHDRAITSLHAGQDVIGDHLEYRVGLN